LRHSGRCRDRGRLNQKRFLLAVIKIQGRATERKNGLHLQREGRPGAVLGWEQLHLLRNSLSVDKKPLSKGHSKGTIQVEKMQGGWIRDQAAISKKGKPDL
jgi:hypothetical protein